MDTTERMRATLDECPSMITVSSMVIILKIFHIPSVVTRNFKDAGMNICLEKQYFLILFMQNLMKMSNVSMVEFLVI